MLVPYKNMGWKAWPREELTAPPDLYNCTYPTGPVCGTGHWEVPRALQERRDGTQPLLPKARAAGGQEDP